MLRITFLTLFLAKMLFGDSFNFTEVRYSDALQRSIELKGEITFEKESLFIKYNKAQREILYKDSILTLKENNESIALPELEAQRISNYFELLILLHSGDESALDEKFTVQKQENKTLLIPKEQMGVFLEKISLLKSDKTIKEVKFFLKNSDTITISIEDEIR